MRFRGVGGLSVANRIADMEVQQRTSAEPFRHASPSGSSSAGVTDQPSL